MMMEDDANGLKGDSDDGEMNDDSSAPPDFAVPPGGVPQEESNPSSEGNSDIGSSVSQTPEGGSSSAPSPPSDPFDLLSMTDAPLSTTPATSTAPATAGGDVDLFSSELVAPGETNPPPVTHDFFSGFETPASGTTTSTPAIDISSQESMMSSLQKPTDDKATDDFDAATGTTPPSPKLLTAESGDLLGLAAPASADTTASATPNDFMNDDFQSMPLSPPEANGVMDPFANNTELFAPTTTSSAVDKTLLEQQESQPQQVEMKKQDSIAEDQSQQKDIDSARPDVSSGLHVTATHTDTPEESASPAISETAPKPVLIQAEAPEPQTQPKEVHTNKGNLQQEISIREPVAAITEVEKGNGAMSTEQTELQEKTTLEHKANSNQKKVEEPQTASKTETSENPGKAEVEDESAHFEEVELIDDNGPSKEAQPNAVQAQRIIELEELLAKSQQEVKDLQKQKVQHEKQSQDSQTETAEILQELQTKLQAEVEKRAEAENSVAVAKKEIQTLSSSLQEKEDQLKTQTAEWQEQLGALEKENDALIAKAKQELEDRKEHERRERVLANKLNDLKKKQATTTDVEEVYEDDLRMLKDDVALKTKKVEELEAAKTSLEEELAKEKEVSGTRIEQLEKAVREEKHLNDERKKKMKSFIEAKAEELKEAKAESEHYQNELNSGNQGMVDLNNRWKTLHAQWVQSQTRNRELQRDLNKIKKDSENQHKVGDSLNAKLSSSAKETEQHKNKRLAAKQELMSVLGQLESEREITNKLRDSVRFTFTAKAQSQHQLLQENLTEFNKQLEALARRLGRPIPLGGDRPSQTLPSLVMEAVDESEASEHDDGSSSSNAISNGGSKEQKRILLETTRLLAKLEVETQHISQGIMALTSCIEQMATLISGGGDKTCFTSLGDIFFGGGMQKAIQADQSRGGNRAVPVRYGHSSHFPTEGGAGTMT